MAVEGRIALGLCTDSLRTSSKQAPQTVAIIEHECAMDKHPVTFPARILRKETFLPRYVVVKPEYVGGRTVAFPADVILDNAGPFRRNVRPWGKESNVFFFNLTAQQCAKAGLDTNDKCVVTLIPRD